MESNWNWKKLVIVGVDIERWRTVSLRDARRYGSISVDLSSSSQGMIMNYSCWWTSDLSILPWQSGQGIWKGTPGGTIVVSKS